MYIRSNIIILDEIQNNITTISNSYQLIYIQFQMSKNHIMYYYVVTYSVLISIFLFLISIKQDIQVPT